ncbi:tail fiber protein [Yersinia enterocolitica]|uniref:Tail fiber protein n=1 Tax=Yersinia enterocolitica TaxID=630 RepID=A0ABP1YEP8_YEREN|nr:phage tail protein [Yersinia enterocolitica]CNE64114.1 tail fiber protein [Yersinia enterocolitica]CQD73282.1 tail fiber protein [Yersinia enterocolitica]
MANEILPFGLGAESNVMTQAEYEALAARSSGFSSGVAKSEQLNKVWRQSSFMASVLADFIAAQSGNDVLDNGNTATLLASLELAIKEYGNSNLPVASTLQQGVTKLSSLTNSSSETLAATLKAVKTVSDEGLKITGNLAEIKAAGPAAIAEAQSNLDLAALLGDALQKANNLSEIKDAGPAAVAQTLLNLGLGDVAHLPQLTGIVGTSRNAKMSIPAASVAATFTADELIVQAGWGGRQYKLSGFSRSINLATTGSGGMDTGTAPATGYVALYAIYNPISGATALLAVNATSAPAPEVYGGANMPAGYTASALVSVWGTSSGQFVVGHQIGRHVGIISNQLYSTAGSVLGYSGISLATAVPPNGKKANMQIVASQTTPNSVIQLYLASTAEGVGAIYVNASANSSSATTTSTNSGYAELDIIGVQTLYFKMANAVAATYTFICGGYEI